LSIGYKDLASKTKEKYVTVQFYCPQLPKPIFKVQFLTLSNLVGSQAPVNYLRAVKFTVYLATSIICSAKEKN
jgi:hypothetical protein